MLAEHVAKSIEREVLIIMAIINKSTKVIFGSGDIGVSIGYRKGSGAVQFSDIKPRPIGEEFESKKKIMDVDEGPVTFIFNNVESLDALIYQLGKLQEIMKNDEGI